MGTEDPRRDPVALAQQTEDEVLAAQARRAPSAIPSRRVELERLLGAARADRRARRPRRTREAVGRARPGRTARSTRSRTASRSMPHGGRARRDRGRPRVARPTMRTTSLADAAACASAEAVRAVRAAAAAGDASTPSSSARCRSASWRRSAASLLGGARRRRRASSEKRSNIRRAQPPVARPAAVHGRAWRRPARPPISLHDQPRSRALATWRASRRSTSVAQRGDRRPAPPRGRCCRRRQPGPASLVRP